MADGIIPTPQDAHVLGDIIRWWLSGGPRTPLEPRRIQAAGRPAVRAVLTEDLEDGEQAEAATLQFDGRGRTQEIRVCGSAAAGTFRLGYTGGTTGELSADAGAEALQAALESVGVPRPRVRAYAGRWLVEIRPRTASPPELIEVAEDTLEGALVTVSDSLWRPAARSVHVRQGTSHLAGHHLAAGTLVTAEWFHGAGYLVSRVEGCCSFHEGGSRMRFRNTAAQTVPAFGAVRLAALGDDLVLEAVRHDHAHPVGGHHHPLDGDGIGHEWAAAFNSCDPVEPGECGYCTAALPAIALCDPSESISYGTVAWVKPDTFRLTAARDASYGEGEVANGWPVLAEIKPGLLLVGGLISFEHQDHA